VDLDRGACPARPGRITRVRRGHELPPGWSEKRSTETPINYEALVQQQRDGREYDEDDDELTCEFRGQTSDSTCPENPEHDGEDREHGRESEKGHRYQSLA
jgi:hypothetical protein